MKLYFAPLEGITTYIYRNTHERFFGGCDAYFTPFITPSDNEKIGRKGFRDILPENNTADIRVQVLTNNSASFLCLLLAGITIASKNKLLPSAGTA